jgi:DNA-directed RNA polymerase specialized sigma24 family protein
LEQLQARFPKPHEALLRQEFGGQRIEEIAADMSVAADTVNKYLAFAKAWLRNHLDERP